MRTRLICLGAVACAVALTQPAAAQVQPAGTGEPLFTNSAQNTQFFEWPAQGAGIDAYQVQYRYYANNAEISSPTVGYGTGAGNTWANWSGVASLQHGGQYGICAQGRYSFTNDSLFYSDGLNSCSMGTILGRRAHTTIDRSKPTAAVTLAGGAQFTKNAQVPLKVDFSDDVAGPFPANFLCFQFGGGPSGLCDAGQGFIYGYTPACSVPAGAGKSTSFNCTADYGSGASPAPDGPIWACVRAADAAIPDNPNSANQSASADKANLSDPSCDGIVLDRTAPAASIGASATTVKAGELVTFQAQATDATSGVADQSSWAWGDNTAGANGASATHTFTQTGTFEVRLTVADNAGNTSTATKVITVTAPTTGSGTGTPDTPTGGGTTTPGGETTTPGGGTTTPGGGTTTPDTGGEDAGDEADEATLTIGAPRKLAAKAKAIRLSLDADAAGRVQLSLVRGGRIVSRGGTAVRAGVTGYKLKLAKRTKAGKYTIKATYTPAGGAARTTKIAITLTGKAGAARASASNAEPGAEVGRGPVAMPDGEFHGRRPLYSPAMQVGFIGSGNMASALARGWGEPVLCSDSGSGRARALAQELGGEALGNRELAERADLVILAHKPAQLAAVAAEVDGAAKAVVSILAGATQADVRAAYPDTPVFCVEPNTPAEVGRGVLAFAAPDAPVDAELYAAVRERFARLGVVLEVPERLMGVAGAAMGVAPAYWALFVEAWVDAAVRHGLPVATAQTLVREGMAGTAELLQHYDGDTLALRRAVTSPGGSTARGLAALERGGVRTALAQAMDDVVGA